MKVFPRDYRTFLELFEPKRELYDGFDFIHVLPTLAEHHDMEVGILLVGLSTHARWDADAPNYLQEATVTYASQHTRSFVVVIGRMSPAEKRSVVTFLADKENHSAYQEYQDTIDHLRRLGENNLANEFEAARKKRSQQPHG